MQNRARASANGDISVTSLSDLSGVHTAVADGAGSAPAPILTGHPIVLTVAGDSVSVATGCNTVGGTARIVDSRLVITDFFTTEMACHGPLDVQEKWVVEMLRSQPRLERSGPAILAHWKVGETYWISFFKDLPTPAGEPS